MDNNNFIHPGFSLISLLIPLVVLWGCGGEASQEMMSAAKVITGTITIPRTVMADSDVNDTNSVYRSNDSIMLSQAIPNPAIIGGYVNRPGSGPPGRSMQLGDVDDYYSTTLLAGQTVRLMTGNPGDATSGINDLELALLNSQGAELSAERSGTTSMVTASATEEYYIRVRAMSGASNYLLNISLDVYQAAASDLHNTSVGQDLDVSREFVPGEIIVNFKNTTHSISSTATGHNLRKKAGNHGRNMLFQLDELNNTISPAANGKAHKESHKNNLKHKTLEVIKSLRQRKDVVSAQPNFIRRATAIPNDSYYQYQWHYPQINLPQAWDITTGNSVNGHQVIVAVIDTGILREHPDLQGQLEAGYDFIRDPGNANDGDGIDEDPNDEGDGVFAASTFHGTHVAGTIAAASNNNLGIAGIAWGAKVMPLRVLGKDGGTDYDIEQAVRYAAGLENDSGSVPPQRADIINLSLGGLTDSTTPPEAYTLARQAGVIMVAAAGNEASNQLSYPASLDGVVSVSAVGIDNNITFYSNYGSTVDLAAPGGNTATDLNSDGFADGVLSTLAAEENSLEYLYAFYQGTSMAAPHVAGVIALMKSVYPEMTPLQFDQWLSAGLLSEDLGSAGRDNYYGYGLIDAYKSVSVASSAAGNSLPELDPIISSNISILNFSYSQNVLNFVIDNGGGGNLTISTINEDSSGWLEIAPVVANAAGLGIYSATVDRALLPDDTAVITANIIIDSSADTLILPVLALSDDQNYPSDAGIHYIQLIDADSGQVIKQIQSAANNGQYNFTMEIIPFGSFILIAGSNSDNNGFICDVAEACGEYPRLGLVEEITINESSAMVTHVNFETNFNQVAVSQARGRHFLP